LTINQLAANYFPWADIPVGLMIFLSPPLKQTFHGGPLQASLNI
jgi:hypothetical protein